MLSSIYFSLGGLFLPDTLLIFFWLQTSLFDRSSSLSSSKIISYSLLAFWIFWLINYSREVLPWLHLKYLISEWRLKAFLRRVLKFWGFVLLEMTNSRLRLWWEKVTDLIKLDLIDINSSNPQEKFKRENLILNIIVIYFTIRKSHTSTLVYC